MENMSLFLLENTMMKKGKQLFNFDYQTVILSACDIILSTARASSVFLSSLCINLLAF